MSRMDKGVADVCPILTQLTEPAKFTTEWDLSNPSHIINDKNRSGKREGASIMIGDYIYVATGCEPSDRWIRMPRQEKASITLGSTTPTQVPTNSMLTPVSPAGLVAQQGAIGFSVDSTGYVKNITGRVLDRVTGTITIATDKVPDGLGAASLYLWSERSHDNGATWGTNQFSLRNVEISSSSESTYTYTSFFYDWEPDAIMRWRFAVKSGSAVRIRSVQELIGSEVIRGYSVLWDIQED